MSEKTNITMDDIARLAGVSKPTVSRALSNHPAVSEVTRKSIQKIAREHGYAVNKNAQKLRTARSDTIVVLLDPRSHPWQRISDPFMYELLAGVSEALSIRKKDLLLSPPGLETPHDFKDMLASKGADGFIFLGQGQRDLELEALAREHIPFVVWGATTDDINYCAVGSDNFKGGELVGDYFLTKGRKNILFVGNSLHKELRLRRDGLFHTLKASGQNIAMQELISQDFSFKPSYDNMLVYLENHPTPDGIFAFSDTAALAIISALMEKGIKVPDDCSVAGYNDIPQAEHSVPPLTTVRQDTSSAGAILVEKLMQAIDGATPKSIKMPTNLIVRST